MKLAISIFLQIVCINQSISQNINSYISETNIDSLVKTVRDLSGEDSIYINGVKTIISDRVSTTGNNLAADYIKEKLSSYNLNTTEQNYSLEGRNIFATQTGIQYPDSIYIICAHYDAITSYCADDNASGAATVIEAARILSGECFDFTIVYALWDEEEIGLLGSNYYAQQANIKNESILGVLNLEMLGYDSDNDTKFDIHTNNDPNSLLVKDSLISIVNSYGLSLIPNVINPGTTASDHASFWNQNYGAIVFGESFFGGDGNPAYHTPNDRINLFNIPYFKELSKLSVGILSTLAKPCITTSIEDLRTKDISIYPNPTSTQLIIDTEQNINEVNILEITGRNVMIIKENTKTINVVDLPSGIYFLKVFSEDGAITKKFVKQ